MKHVDISIPKPIVETLYDVLDPLRKSQAYSIVTTLNKTRSSAYFRNSGLEESEASNLILNKNDNSDNLKYLLEKFSKPELAIQYYKELKNVGFQDILLKGLHGDEMSCDIVFGYYGDEYLKDFNKLRDFKGIRPGRYGIIICTDEKIYRQIALGVENAKKECSEVFVLKFNDAVVSGKVKAAVKKAKGKLIDSFLSRSEIENKVLFEKNQLQTKLLYNRQNGISDFDALIKRRDRALKTPIEELVIQELGITDKFEVECFIFAVGENRIRVFVLNDVDLTLVHRFLTGEKVNIKDMVSKEFKIYIGEWLSNIGAKKLRYDVVKNWVRVDAQAYLEASVPLTFGFSDNSGKLFIGPGQINFMSRIYSSIGSDIVTQMNERLCYFNNMTLFTLKDSKVYPLSKEKIDQAGVNTIEAPVSYGMLKGRLFDLTKRYELKKTRAI